MNNSKIAMDITPDTKVGALLNNYPHLEQFLIDMSPTFAKLRNPILRKTVAKIATLRQVAEIGNMPLGTLINSLRSAAGLSERDDFESESAQNTVQPDWINRLKVAKSLDARPILEKGEHPLNYVMKDLAQLKENELYELITPFLPAPLIDAAKQKGFRAWTMHTEKDIFTTYFGK